MRRNNQAPPCVCPQSLFRARAPPHHQHTAARSFAHSYHCHFLHVDEITREKRSALSRLSAKVIFQIRGRRGFIRITMALIEIFPPFQKKCRNKAKWIHSRVSLSRKRNLLRVCSPRVLRDNNRRSYVTLALIICVPAERRSSRGGGQTA